VPRVPAVVGRLHALARPLLEVEPRTAWRSAVLTYRSAADQDVSAHSSDGCLCKLANLDRRMEAGIAGVPARRRSYFRA
jgi:hypothetical protein